MRNSERIVNVCIDCLEFSVFEEPLLLAVGAVADRDVASVELSSPLLEPEVGFILGLEPDGSGVGSDQRSDRIDFHVA